MPYEIKQSSKGYCVHKQGGDSVPGGCHKSKSKALRHLRALYANEPEALKADGKGYGAKVGETISGNLVRGAGGKFSSSGSAQPAQTEEEGAPRQRRQKLGTTAARREAAKLQAREDKKRATAAASEAKRQARRQETERRRAALKKQREQEAKEREIERLRKLAASRKAVIDATQLDAKSLSALEQFAKGDDLEAGDTTDMLVAMGLVSKSSGTGEYVMSAQGKSLLSALSSGDIRQAKDAINAGFEARAAERNRRIRKEEESNKEASLSVFKDKSGRYRWVLLSSNAYRDRDGEIVSTKALQDDVARADRDKNYGPLRWWHVPGLDIGDCDFNAMSGRVLVESGTFRNESVGKAIFSTQKSLQASIGFKHPRTEPDIQGVYHNIRRFERSLTPQGRAANPFTRLVVQEKQMDDMQKVQALKEAVGEDVFNTIISLVQSTHKDADLMGTAYKGGEKPTLTAEQVAAYLRGKDEGTLNVINVGTPVPTISTSGTVTTSGAADFTIAPETDNLEGETVVKDLGEMEEMVYAGDMSPHELVSMVSAGVAHAIAPLLSALDVTTKMGDFEKRMGGMVEEMKGLVSTHKSDDIALLQEQQSRQEAALQATLKELAAAHEKTVQEQAKTALALKEAQDKLAELMGEQPRASTREQPQGYRASQATDNIVNEGHRLKESKPTGIDPNFFTSLVPGLFPNNSNGEPPKY